MPIRILESTVASQIAAGEVIEHPAAVAKELVENAIDAGATRITVEARGGGIRELKVQDDGCGIPSDEIELAFARHATSKLQQADDLWNIQTLGFRGEALPSIASVAQVTCLSRSIHEEVGTELRIAGGEVQARMPRGCSPGTSITMRHLFYNTPVRLQYLRSEATEMSAITMIVQQYALAYPEIRFTLLLDGRLALQTSGNGNLQDVIIEIYRLDIARQLFPLQAQYGEGEDRITIQGFISPPGTTRSSRNSLHLFVNRRAIQPRGVLVYVIEEAYHTLLMKGRHPVAVLDIRVHPRAVDVNVHPTKSEVKFRHTSRVHGVLGRSIREALTEGAGVQIWDTNVAPPDGVQRRFEVRPMPTPPPSHSTSAWGVGTRVWDTRYSRWDVGSDEGSELFADNETTPSCISSRHNNGETVHPPSAETSSLNSSPEEVGEMLRATSLQPGQGIEDVPDVRDTEAHALDLPLKRRGQRAHRTPNASDAETISQGGERIQAKLPPLRVVGQVGLTYIVAESPGGMYLIDQHAAHERIAYEQLMAQQGTGAIQPQELLMPQTITLPPAAVELLIGNTEKLKAWGFMLEEWGEGMVQIRAIPALLALEKLHPALLEIADHLSGSGGSTPNDWRESMLITLACHTSVRAGQMLSLEEMRTLLRQLEQCTNPHTCPHGRPTMVLLTPGQLERQFGR